MAAFDEELPLNGGWLPRWFEFREKTTTFPILADGEVLRRDIPPNTEAERENRQTEDPTSHRWGKKAEDYDAYNRSGEEAGQRCAKTAVTATVRT